jgi:ABC-2 type transport system ATP-binding protein
MIPLSAENLGKLFASGIKGGKVTALKDLTLSVNEGEVYGLLGPNGAGKTTAMKIFMGLLYPSWGKAEVMGRPCWNVEVKQKVGFLPEGPYFYEYLSGQEFLDFYGRLFGLERAIRTARTDELLSLVGLDNFKKLKLRRYSKGMLQRIGLAQALINDPELVVLDEPMAGLDPVGRKQLADIILGLKEKGKTIFFSSHILADVQRLCDRIAIINRGSLIYQGPVDDFLGKELQGAKIIVQGPEEKLAGLMEGGEGEMEVGSEGITLQVKNQELVDKLMATLPSQGFRVKSVVPIRPSLEELFVQVIDASERKLAGNKG